MRTSLVTRRRRSRGGADDLAAEGAGRTPYRAAAPPRKQSSHGPDVLVHSAVFVVS